jgi:hypothetical protein
MTAPPARELPLAAVAHRFRSRILAQPGLLLKRLVLGAGAVYFTMVTVTNVVNFVASVGDFPLDIPEFGERGLHRIDHQDLLVAGLDG